MNIQRVGPVAYASGTARDGEVIPPNFRPNTPVGLVAGDATSVWILTNGQVRVLPPVAEPSDVSFSWLVDA